MQLAAGAIHVWRVDLCDENGAMQPYSKCLSQDEIHRAERFHYEGDRRHFTVARSATREILGRYLNRHGRDVVFSYSPRGKPELLEEMNELGLMFNLSHSGERALLAVAKRLCLGIDIEFVNRGLATEKIAECFFSTQEASALRAIPPHERAAAFFSCWTRKEAYLKALGEGLSASLDSFDVGFRPGVPKSLASAKASLAGVSSWSIYDIPAGPEYKAALAVEGQGHKLRYWQWKAPFWAGRNETCYRADLRTTDEYQSFPKLKGDDPPAS